MIVTECTFADDLEDGYSLRQGSFIQVEKLTAGTARYARSSTTDVGSQRPAAGRFRRATAIRPGQERTRAHSARPADARILGLAGRACSPEAR